MCSCDVSWPWMVTHPRLMSRSLVPTLCPKLMSCILWWSVLAPKNLSVVLICVELMSVVWLCSSDQWWCVELQWLVMKMTSSVICYVQWSVYFCDDDEDGKFCDLLCAMVCVLLWWNMRNQWCFLWTFYDDNDVIFMMKIAMFCDENKYTLYAATWHRTVMTRGEKLWRHMVRNCGDTWHPMKMWRQDGWWHGTAHVAAATSPASVSTKATLAIGLIHATWHSL